MEYYLARFWNQLSNRNQTLMEEENQLDQLNKHLDNLLDASSENMKKWFESSSQQLSTRLKELIELYSNNIKTVSLISGTVAPFSLTLLQVKLLNVNIVLIVVGFVVLVLNIVLSQILLTRELKTVDRRINRAMVNYVLALGDQQTINDKNKDHSTRVTSMADLTTRASELESLLMNDKNQPSITLIDDHRRLSKFMNWVIGIFAFGCGMIILSICINPILHFLATVC